MALWQTWWWWTAVSYVSGSIPFALLIGMSHGVDVRTVGSGNVGSTNVARAVGRPWGVLCFGLDVLKGFLPVLFGGIAMSCAGKMQITPAQAWEWLGIAVAAVLGHVFPPWLKFRGGKGVATSLGVVLGLWPLLAAPCLAAIVTWTVLLGLFRYVSLASVVATATLPITIVIARILTSQEYARSSEPFLIVSALLAVLVIFRHRTNLLRLFKGTEPKLGEHRPV